MRRQQKVIASLLAASDIPVGQLNDLIQHATGDYTQEEILAGNMRIRLSHDEREGSGDREYTVYKLDVLYSAPMTEEDIAEERLILDKRKAEREASDRVMFDTLRKRYGWE